MLCTVVLILCVYKNYSLMDFKRKNILADHQISSYNHLIDTILPDILYSNFPLSVDIRDNDKISKVILLKGYINEY